MKMIQGIFLLAIVVIGGGYYYYKSTPEYSLKQLKVALEERDRIEFTKKIVRKRTGHYTSEIKIDEIEKLECVGASCKIKLTLVHSTNRKSREVDIEMRKSSSGWKVSKINGLTEEVYKYLKL